METRTKLASQLATMEAATSREEEAVTKMNEEKMIRALNSNVKLGCLQSVFDKVVIVLYSAPSVPQPVVQSRRRPLLGPSPG